MKGRSNVLDIILTIELWTCDDLTDMMTNDLAGCLITGSGMATREGSKAIRALGRTVGLIALISVVFAVQSAWGQVDLSGEWANRLHEDQPSRGSGFEIGEYEGLPINDAARFKAESWSAAVYSLPERQCIPFSADMGLTISNVRIWKEIDSTSQIIVAWHIHHEWQAQEQVIWMDGRQHPPDYAAHKWQGFSTGVSLAISA
jgi:hypothetical protein